MTEKLFYTIAHEMGMRETLVHVFGSEAVLLTHVQVASTKSAWSRPSVHDEQYAALRAHLQGAHNASRRHVRVRDFRGQYFKAHAKDDGTFVTTSHAHKGELVVFPSAFNVVWDEVVRLLFVNDKLTATARAKFLAKRVEFERNFIATAGQRSLARGRKASLPSKASHCPFHGRA